MMLLLEIISSVGAIAGIFVALWIEDCSIRNKSRLRGCKRSNDMRVLRSGGNNDNDSTASTRDHR